MCVFRVVVRSVYRCAGCVRKREVAGIWRKEGIKGEKEQSGRKERMCAEANSSESNVCGVFLLHSSAVFFRRKSVLIARLVNHQTHSAKQNYSTIFFTTEVCLKKLQNIIDNYWIPKSTENDTKTHGSSQAVLRRTMLIKTRKQAPQKARGWQLSSQTGDLRSHVKSLKTSEYNRWRKNNEHQEEKDDRTVQDKMALPVR